MYKWVLRGGNLAKACAGWFGLYVAAGGVLANVITPSAYTALPGCYPHYETFGAIGSNCPTWFVNVFWFFALGLPRLAILPMVLVAGLIIGAAKKLEFYDLLNALPFAFVSLPFLFLYYVSFRFWRPRHTRIAALIPVLIGAETLFLGLKA